MLRTLSRYWSAFRRWPAVFRWPAVLFGVILLMAIWPKPAHGQDPYLTGDALQAEVLRLCGDGCVVFNREEAAQLWQGLGRMLTERAQEAYDLGKADQRSRCASLVKEG